MKRNNEDKLASAVRDVIRSISAIICFFVGAGLFAYGEWTYVIFWSLGWIVTTIIFLLFVVWREVKK
jgi:hypothetical protein